jgi:sporulation related protein
MKKLFLSVLMLILVPWLSAQNTEEGSVTIYQDARVDSMISMHVTLNKKIVDSPDNDGITGYRIQIFFDSGNNSKSKAIKVIDEFTEEYNNVAAYLTFGEPFYRVRVGDFRKKINALGFLEKIKRNYPNAWIIKDKINFPVINPQIETL